MFSLFCYQKLDSWPCGHLFLKVRKLAAKSVAWPQQQCWSDLHIPLHIPGHLLTKKVPLPKSRSLFFYPPGHGLLLAFLASNIWVIVQLTVFPWYPRNLSHVSITLTSCHQGYAVYSDNFTLVWKAALGSIYFFVFISLSSWYIFCYR